MRTDGVVGVFSHQLAARAGATAAQVRRDLMAVGYEGSPQRGYDVEALLAAVEACVDPAELQPVALVGVGNLGRAVLAFLHGRRPKLAITAAFDRDPAVVGRMVHGCMVHGMGDLPEVIAREGINVAIVAVPAPDAQAVATQLVAAGVKGLLNFAPTRIAVGKGIAVEDMDMTTALEKVAYFARQGGG
jgi:redox-sensing transcriptional repressor